MTTIKFSEAHDLTEAQINTERRQIQGVVLIRAGMSKNKRDYPAAMLEQSVKVFEGSKAYDNHAQGARSIRDISGWYSNVRYQEGKLIADRHFAETGAGNDAWAIAKAVMSGEAPKNLAGLSINAIGTAKKHTSVDGALEIESITAAVSVDDVSEAAAGGSYRESANDDLTAAFWESLPFDEFFHARPDYIERIQKEMKNIRQDEVVKAAKAEADQLRQTLLERESELKTLQAEREAALLEATTARRELAVERTLEAVSLPVEWKKSIRETLLLAEHDQWERILKIEKAKALSAGHKTQITGAGQQVNAPLKENKSATSFNPLPLPGEDAETWNKRMRLAQQEQ